MYQTADLANFALYSFARGLEGLTAEEAITRLDKADGTQMNAISWIVGHVSWQWVFRATRAGVTRGLGESEATALCDLRARVNRFASGSHDAAPPSLAEALQLLDDARSLGGWIANADSTLMATMVGDGPPVSSPPGACELVDWLAKATIPGENLGTALMRCILHTWFHIGEINTIRQMLGHAEIAFVGPMTGRLQWRAPSEAASGDGGAALYAPADLAGFALHSFARGLEGLGEEDARTGLTKADGSHTNAISWIVAHAGRHWLQARVGPTGEPVDPELAPFATGSDDPTPPPLGSALEVLAIAQRSNDWIAGADDVLMAKPGAGRDPNDTVGTRLMRAVLHTWFHTGEINGIRQMLGHPEIAFVGPMKGRLEWQAAIASIS